jgi:multiple sugar transport system ATP-binding protein
MNFITAKLAEQAGGIVVDCGDLRMKLPTRLEASAKPYVGKTVTFGIRPEDIHDRATVPPQLAASTNAVTVMVDVTEPLGSNVYAYLKAGKHDILGCLAGDTGARPGGSLDVIFDMERSHLFDMETDLSLFAPTAPQLAETA